MAGSWLVNESFQSFNSPLPSPSTSVVQAVSSPFVNYSIEYHMAVLS